MVVDIEVGIIGFDSLHAQGFKHLDELLEYQFEAFPDSLRVFRLVGNGPLEIVENRQDGGYRLLASVENKLRFLLQRTLLVVVEFGSQTDIFVFPLLGFFLYCGLRISLLFCGFIRFGLCSGVLFRLLRLFVPGCLFAVLFQLFAFHVYILLFFPHI